MIRIGYMFTSAKAKENYLEVLKKFKEDAQAGSAITFGSGTGKTAFMVVKNTRRLQYAFFSTSEDPGFTINFRNKIEGNSKIYTLNESVCTLEHIKLYTVSIN